MRVTKSGTVLLAILTFILLPLSDACIPARAVIESVVLSSALNSANEPANITNEFPMDQDVIYAIATIGNVRRETTVTTLWFLKKGELPSQNIEIGCYEQTIHTSTTVSFGLALDPGLSIGEYQVDLSLDGQKMASVPFSIILPPTPTVQTLHDNSASPNATDNIHTSYSWTIFGTHFNLNMEIPRSLYDFYKSKTRISTLSPSVYSLYVSHPHDDEYISRIADAIKGMSQKKGFTADQYSKSIIQFVRSITYATDIETTTFDEYPKYPIETLVDAKGDCEDSAILLASIMQAGGFSPVLLITKPSVIPGHAAVGVAEEGSPDLFYYHYEDKKYTYVEPTSSNLSIGQIPEPYKADDFQVVALRPLPSITYSFDDLRLGRVYRIRVYVKNIGSIQVNDIIVVAELLHSEFGNNIIYQQSDPFTLSVDQEAIVTFYLRYEIPSKHEIRVYSHVGDDVGYTLAASLDGP